MELRYNVPAGAKYLCKSQVAAGLTANLLSKGRFLHRTVQVAASAAFGLSSLGLGWRSTGDKIDPVEARKMERWIRRRLGGRCLILTLADIGSFQGRGALASLA